MSWAADEPLSAEARIELIQNFERSWESGVEVVYGAFPLDGVRLDGVPLDRVVGGCGLIRRAGGEVLEIGYWVHVDFVRQGFATEMATGLTDAAFTVDGVERVEIHHDRANRASRCVPAGLGFTFEGEKPDQVMAPAEEGVDCTWATGRADWVNRRHQRR